MIKLWTPDKKTVAGFSRRRRAFLSAAIKALLVAGIALCFVGSNGNAQSSAITGLSAATGNSAAGSVIPASGGGGGNNLAVVKARKAVSDSANNCAVSISPAAGNLLVVMTTQDNANISSISDNIGTTTGWTLAKNAFTSGASHSECWYKANVPAGITTVTVTATGGSFITAIIHEVSGASTTTPFTSGEAQSFVGGSATTNPQTPSQSNGTANSIFFASERDGSSGGNPATLNINGTGTVGVWNLADSTNSQELNQVANDCLSVPNIIVTSTTSEKHGWTTASITPVNMIVCFH